MGRRGKIAFRIKPHTHQRCSEGSNKTLYAPGPRDPTKTEPGLPLSVWVSPAEAGSAVACHRGSGCSRPERYSVWHKSSWRRSPSVPPQSHRADNPQTGEQLYQRNSCTVAKVLGPTTDFPTWESGKGTENPGNLTVKSSGICYRTSTGTGTWRAQTKPCVHQNPGERSCNPTRACAGLTSERVGVSGAGTGWQWPAAGSGPLKTTVLASVLLREMLLPLP